MANYYEMCVSNDFRVHEPEEVIKILGMTYGISESYFSDSNTNTICFGNYQSDECLNIEGAVVAFRKLTDDVELVFDGENELLTDYVDDEEQFYTVPLIKYLQEQLIDENEYILITTIGNEKLRYVGGDVFVITKNDTKYKSLYYVGRDLVESLGLKYKE